MWFKKYILENNNGLIGLNNELFMEDEIRKRLILDFSGIIIDVEKETQYFQGMYPYLLFDELNLDRKKYLPIFNEIKENLRNNDSQGFFMNGQDVMPASCEPSALIHATGQQLIKNLNYFIF